VSPKTIWKFFLNGPESFITMPAKATILRFGVQENEIVMWALVLPDNPAAVRHISAVNTGVTFTPGNYIDTVTVEGIVWHLFDHGDPEARMQGTAE
jgi:hypothetical protein